MSFLKWPEPWGGYGEFDDTGLNDRIWHWELAYEINRCNDFKFTILVENKWWPELNYLSLPNTIGVDEWGEDFKKDCTFFDTNDLDKKQDFKLDTNINWYPTCGHKFTRCFRNEYEETRPLQLIDIKNKHLKDTIKNMVKKAVGVHIRRGKGIDSPENLFRETHSFVGYPHVDNEYYLDTMNKIKEIKFKQKFYLSSDFSFSEQRKNLEVFYENFDIIDYNHILEKLNDDVDMSDKYFDKVLHKKCLINIIDLFSLSYCSFIIMYYNSQFSSFAKDYRNINHIGYPDEFVPLSYKESMIW
jgi:hypothetical protein